MKMDEYRDSMEEFNRRKTDREEADWEVDVVNMEIQNRLFFSSRNDSIKLRPDTHSLPFDIEKDVYWGDVMMLACDNGLFKKISENEYVKLVDGFSTDEKGRPIRDLTYFVEKHFA
jgi:hypothetical protein